MSKKTCCWSINDYMRKCLKSWILLILPAFYLIYFTSCSKEEDDFSIDHEGQGPIEDGDYYVATWGNDTNSGTFENPWATWQKAFCTAGSGDIVYFRGGVYYADGGCVIDPYRWPEGDWGSTGTEDNWIHYLNYPDEKPILDLSNYNPEGNWNVGIGLNYISYVHFRGLTVRNIYQYRDGVTARGIEAYACSNIIFEQMTACNVSGRGFGFFGGFGAHDIDPHIPDVPADTVWYINCDSYSNCDSLCDDLAQCETSALGGIADGFKFNNANGAFIGFNGCRSWNNSDDGFDGNGPCRIEITNCWSFNNGRLEGDGYGWKLAGPHQDSNVVRIFNHNIAAYNRWTGLGLNIGTGRYMYDGYFYNNTFYHNTFGITQSIEHQGSVHPIYYVNNVAYANTSYNFDNAADFIAHHNNFNSTYPFDDSIPTSDQDFVSIDATQLSLQREDNGSLPTITFLRLDENSDLIDAGIDVGFPFVGIAPDMGAVESN